MSGFKWTAARLSAQCTLPLRNQTIAFSECGSCCFQSSPGLLSLIPPYILEHEIAHHDKDMQPLLTQILTLTPKRHAGLIQSLAFGHFDPISNTFIPLFSASKDCIVCWFVPAELNISPSPPPSPTYMTTRSFMLIKNPGQSISHLTVSLQNKMIAYANDKNITILKLPEKAMTMQSSSFSDDNVILDSVCENLIEDHFILQGHIAPVTCCGNKSSLFR